jgi:hypothetical protein
MPRSHQPRRCSVPAATAAKGATPTERLSRNERPLWVGLMRPGEAHLMAVVSAIGAAQDRRIKLRSRVVNRRSPKQQLRQACADSGRSRDPAMDPLGSTLARSST